MNASCFDFRKRHDASRQLAFECALVVDLFLEIRESEIRAIENFKSDAATLGQTLACHLNADFGDFVCGDFDCPAIGSELIRNLEFGQLLHDALRFLGIEIGVKRLIFNLTYKVDEYPEQHQNECSRTRQSELLLKRVAREEGLDLVERTLSSHR